MAFDFEKFFSGAWESAKEILAREAGKSPIVQKAIGEQKVKIGKNVLWDYFPFIAIGLVVFVLIKKV